MRGRAANVSDQNVAGGKAMMKAKPSKPVISMARRNRVSASFKRVSVIFITRCQVVTLSNCFIGKQTVLFLRSDIPFGS